MADRDRDRERERRAAPPGSGSGGRERPTEPIARRSREGVWPLVLAALVLGALLGAGGATLLDREEPAGFGGGVDDSRYQAVILANDKVYFGRIRSVSADFFQLRDAFFLRETRAGDDAEPVRALLPVNREIHAPENRMLIRKDEVVIVENLAKNSPILTEIQRQTGQK